MTKQRRRLLYLLERQDGALTVGSSTHPARRMLEHEKSQGMTFVLLREWQHPSAFRIEMAVHRILRNADYDLAEDGDYETYHAPLAAVLAAVKQAMQDLETEKKRQSMSDEKQTERTEPTDADVIAALNGAHASLIAASVMISRRYGSGTEKAAQLCGAAVMISEDWIPAIEQETASVN